MALSQCGARDSAIVAFHGSNLYYQRLMAVIIRHALCFFGCPRLQHEDGAQKERIDLEQLVSRNLKLQLHETRLLNPDMKTD
jgi:hypothetical protein